MSSDPSIAAEETKRITRRHFISYVNGDLFADDDALIPQFTAEIADLLRNPQGPDTNFKWREISPTIFGAVFESTLNPELRRQGGMHYTSVENIHKVIDPLFLDNLKAEFSKIRQLDSVASRRRALPRKARPPHLP